MMLKEKEYPMSNLIGNFASVHPEWTSSGEASGWSPSYSISTYSISTILITLQGALLLEYPLRQLLFPQDNHL
jgi:hypothetical protein